MKVTRKKVGMIAWNIFKYFFLIVLSYIVLFQLMYMLTYAFRTLEDTYDPSVVWVPKTFTWQHFIDAFNVMDYMNAAWVSVSVGLVSGMIEVFICGLIGYGFARFRFFEKNMVFALVILTIVIPANMIIVPTYLNYTSFDIFGILKGIGTLLGENINPNLIDTNATFYLPSLFGVGIKSGLFIFIYRKYFEQLPKELEEAAYIDGAGPVRTFFRVIMPSSSVAYLTVFIFSMVWHWNEYYQFGMYFSEKKSLSVMLSMLSDTIKAGGLMSGIADSRNIRMAACLLFIFPMIVLYAIAQKKFIKSIDHVGIVG